MCVDKSVVLGLFVCFVVAEMCPSTNHAARLDTEDKAAAESRRSASGNSGTIHLNFRDADLLQIINLMSELTGKNFLVDEKVKGKVTIVAPKPVTLEEAYQVFLSILEIQGFSVVEQGPVIKILPTVEVREHALPTATDGRRLPSAISDEYVTQLIPLQFADANELRALLTPLVSKQSNLLAYPPTNTIILTDISSNIVRLLKIIRTLDVESPGAVIKVVTLKHAAADQLATALQTAMEGLEQIGSGSEAPAGGAGAEGTPAPRRPVAARPAAATSRGTKAPKIIPDVRTNTLVVIATPTDMTAAENLVAKLDIPTPEGRGQVHVYYLAHANAEELARVLTAQVSDSSRSSQTRDTTTPTPSPTTPTGTTTQTTQRRPTTSTGGPFTATTQQGVTITADKATNALVITAPPEAYVIIKEVIEKLDIRRSQVLVESLIAEVTLNQANGLGVEWRVVDEPDGVQVFGSSTGSTGDSGTGILNTLTTNPLTGVQGLLIGALRNSITIGGNEIFNIPAVLHAFQGNSDVNILATPNLLTTDNEEAEIVIGEQRPFIRSSQDTPIGGVTGTSTINTFEFKDLGITLRITPQISQGKTVRLKLFQEVTNFVSESQVGAVVTTKRKAQTTVIVDDAQTIVIGGLIQEDRNESETQVPCLGNLPVLGWLFKQTTAARKKTNLLIFLTPHIVTSPDDVNRITEHKRQQSDKAPLIEERLRESRPQENVEILLN
jgi:general secretion pathway protein D